MNLSIITKTYNEPSFCEKEILRYAGCKSFEEELLQPLRTCIKEVQGRLTYKVCYRELPVVVTDTTCRLGDWCIESEHLARNLRGCNSVIIFGATIGVEIDRLIAKYGRISPSKALLLQAIGAERIEALCDVFCEDIAREKNMATRPRFSPGYGDLPLEMQKEFFRLLDCSKKIGLSLNDSLLMSPSKSVTAFLGLTDGSQIMDGDTKEQINKCAACTKIDCEYRGVL